MLKEFRAAAGGSNINLRMHILDQGSEEAIELTSLAEKRYGIKPEPVQTRTRGQIKDEEVLLAAAFTCGLEKVVVPFFDYGVPVEYELIRSICTVAKKERKKVGIVRTEARLFGGFSFAGGRPQETPKQEIVTELEKQYTVKEVDPTTPIEKPTPTTCCSPSSRPRSARRNSTTFCRRSRVGSRRRSSRIRVRSTWLRRPRASPRCRREEWGGCSAVEAARNRRAT